MEIKFRDYIDVLELRYYLIYGTEEELKKEFDDNEKYIKMIDTMDQLLDIDDCGFALIDNLITDKIFTLINHKRFEMQKTNKEVFNKINRLIQKINKKEGSIKNSKEEFILQYVAYQEQKRDTEFYTVYELLDSMGVDSLMLDYLGGCDFPEDVPNDLVESSIMSLNNDVPELFKLEDMRNRTIDLLDERGIVYEETEFEKLKRTIKEKVRRR